MKIFIVSDIHGAFRKLERVISIAENYRPDLFVLLGDLLYHGPRNSLPEDYDSAKTYELLNSIEYPIMAVRGNCDSEVDQMVLDFPIMSDYHMVNDEGTTLFFTHGHLYSPPKDLPKITKNSFFFYGHTHRPECSQLESLYICNPGSIGIPRESVSSFGVYQNKNFQIFDLDNNLVKEICSN